MKTWSCFVNGKAYQMLRHTKIVFSVSFILIALVSGCTFTPYDEQFNRLPEQKSEAETTTAKVEESSVILEPKPLSNIKHIFLGMTQNEVVSVMGDALTVGYKWNEETGTISPITLEQPLRDDVLALGEDEYEVMYYFTNIKSPDGQITSREQTPLIFEDHKLIGMGYDFLESLKRRFQ